MIYGYTRVSIDGQRGDAQVKAHAPSSQALCRNVDAISGTYPTSGEIDAADGHERFGQSA